MRIYTKTGDKGQTSLYSGGRVPKTDGRIATCGTLDELNCHLGAALAATPTAPVAAEIPLLQRRLFLVGADVAMAPEGRPIERIAESHIRELEALIDRLHAGLPKMTGFVLPGGNPAAAALHIARTVCRRAEREALTAQEAHSINPLIATYLNRLSDLLYILACTENHEAGVAEIPL